MRFEHWSTNFSIEQQAGRDRVRVGRHRFSGHYCNNGASAETAQLSQDSQMRVMAHEAGNPQTVSFDRKPLCSRQSLSRALQP